MKSLFVLLSLAACWGCTPRQAVLEGHIENYQGEVVRICTEGNAFKRDTLSVDSLGNFEFMPDRQEGMIYEISVKDHMPWVSVYLAEGDCSEVRLTLTADKQVETTFSGDRVAENEYLRAYSATESSRKWYEPGMNALPFKDYRAVVDGMDDDLQKMLLQIKDSELRAQFAVKQHLMLQTQLAYYVWRQDGNDKEDVEDMDYANFITTIDVNNPMECNDDILGVVISRKMKLDGYDGTGDYLPLYLETLDKLVTNPEVKNAHATGMLLQQFQYFSGNPLSASVERYNAICTNDSLKAVVNAEYAEYDRVYGNLMPGKPAPDFEMMDVNGKKCRLSDLKGKYVFVDFWATWCAPCREEIPHMAKLQEHFANDSRIALVSISVDANVKTWKNFLAKDKPTWEQYVVDAKNNAILDKEYRIFGIPHFMLLDPEGCFVQYSFTRPSFSGCAEEIEQIINR